MPEDQAFVDVLARIEYGRGHARPSLIQTATGRNGFSLRRRPWDSMTAPGWTRWGSTTVAAKGPHLHAPLLEWHVLHVPDEGRLVASCGQGALWGSAGEEEQRGTI